jgi:hypothetical protein
MRIYFVAGTNESATMVTEINKAKSSLQNKGLTAENTFVKLDSYGQHNENYWKGEFAAAYQWLFQNTVLSTDNIAIEKPGAHYTNNQLFIRGLPLCTEVRIFDITGRQIEKTMVSNGPNKLKNELVKGHYILKTEVDSVRFVVR